MKKIFFWRQHRCRRVSHSPQLFGFTYHPLQNSMVTFWPTHFFCHHKTFFRWIWPVSADLPWPYPQAHNEPVCFPHLPWVFVSWNWPPFSVASSGKLLRAFAVSQCTHKQTMTPVASSGKLFRGFAVGLYVAFNVPQSGETFFLPCWNWKKAHFLDNGDVEPCSSETKNDDFIIRLDSIFFHRFFWRRWRFPGERIQNNIHKYTYILLFAGDSSKTPRS